MQNLRTWFSKTIFTQNFWCLSCWQISSTSCSDQEPWRHFWPLFFKHPTFHLSENHIGFTFKICTESYHFLPPPMSPPCCDCLSHRSFYFQLAPLQTIQYSSQNDPFKCIRFIFQTLQWLPISSRAEAKVLKMAESAYSPLLSLLT